MRPFAYARPSTKDEALDLLTRDGSTALAGGTDLLSLLKSDVESYDLLVDLKGVDELRQVELSAGSLRFGPLVTLEALRTSEDVVERLPALVDAIDEHRAPQIRSMGTLGGDLCQRPRCWYYRAGFGLLARREQGSMPEGGDGRYHAIFDTGAARFVSASRLAPALIAHDAVAVVQGAASGERRLALLDFFRTPSSEGEREIDLRPGEMITAIEVPANPRASAGYEVHVRRSLDWPLAAGEHRAGALGREGRCRSSRSRTRRGRADRGRRSRRSPGRSSQGRARHRGGRRPGGREGSSLPTNAYKIQLARTAAKRAVLRAAERMSS